MLLSTSARAKHGILLQSMAGLRNVKLATDSCDAHWELHLHSHYDHSRLLSDQRLVVAATTILAR